MVFQNYALYPYMNVYENMAFSLRCVKMDRQEIERRVHHAADMLIAGFIGSPTMNFIPVEVVAEDGEIVLACGKSGTNKLFISSILGRKLQTDGYMGKTIIWGVRAEDLYTESPLTFSQRKNIESADRQEKCRLPMQVSVRENLGAEILVHGEIKGEPVCARVKPGCSVIPGETVWMYPDMTKVKLFDCVTGENILYENSSCTEIQKGAGAGE